MTDASYVTLTGASWADDDELPEVPSAGPKGWGQVAAAPVLSIAEQLSAAPAPKKEAPPPTKSVSSTYTPPSQRQAAGGSSSWGSSGSGSVAIQRNYDSYESSSSSYDRKGGYGDSGGYGSRAPKEKNPLPENPPWMMFCGNLHFSVSEEMLWEYFGELGVKNIRLIADMDGKSKGFAYVEFNELEALTEALSCDGLDFHGRNINVDVAQSRGERGGSSYGGFDEDRYGSGGDRAGNWRSTNTGGSSSGGGFGDRSGGRGGGYGDRSGGGGGGYGDRSGGGGGFGRRDDREDSFGPSDTASNWRSNKPAYGSGAGGSSRPTGSQRPKLDLKPRTKPLGEVGKPTERKSGNSPFGAAVGIDQEKQDRLAMERLERAKKKEEELSKRKEEAAAARLEAREAREKQLQQPRESSNVPPSKAEGASSWRSNKTANAWAAPSASARGGSARGGSTRGGRRGGAVGSTEGASSRPKWNKDQDGFRSKAAPTSAASPKKAWGAPAPAADATKTDATAVANPFDALAGDE